MGQYAPEVVNKVFAKKQLTDEQKAGFTKHDELGSVLMNHFDTLPPSREVSLAKTKLEESIFWANKSIIAAAK